MKSPEGKSSAWKETGAFVARSRSAFCHVNLADPESVTSDQKRELTLEI